MAITPSFTVNVTTASTTVLPAKLSRTHAIIINNSDVTVWLALGPTATLSQGIPLYANGGYYEITKINPYCGAITAIHGSTGNKAVSGAEV
jgi:hypothetical protein